MQEPTKYDSIFWIETEKTHPNPYQPRREFDESRLKALAESIRQYGVLQPIVVTRIEKSKEDGGISAEYELIAGERRLRASKLIGLKQIPAVIRAQEDGRVKLELAIIENLQREDLNAIDRATALAQLAKEFGISHSEIGAKVGRSREYVSNSIRLLQLPEAIQKSVINKELSEGHARALLMLSDRPEERDTLFRDILLRKTSVRVTEQLARRIATDKIRKHNKTAEMMDLEKSLTETLGTRVVIENRPNKTGRLLIEFFSAEDLTHIADVFATRDMSKEYLHVEKEEKSEDAVLENSVDVKVDNSSQEDVAKEENNTLKDTVNTSNEPVSENETQIVGDTIDKTLSTETDSQEKVLEQKNDVVDSENTELVVNEGETTDVAPKVEDKPQENVVSEYNKEDQEDGLYSVRDFTV